MESFGQKERRSEITTRMQDMKEQSWGWKEIEEIKFDISTYFHLVSSLSD